jgi:hypothetical protein
MDLFYQRVKVGGVLTVPLIPPLLQSRALFELIVEDLISLAQEFA